MAKLSIAGPSFEGNAARKLPPRSEKGTEKTSDAKSKYFEEDDVTPKYDMMSDEDVSEELSGRVEHMLMNQVDTPIMELESLQKKGTLGNWGYKKRLLNELTRNIADFEAYGARIGKLAQSDETEDSMKTLKEGVQRMKDAIESFDLEEEEITEVKKRPAAKEEEEPITERMPKRGLNAQELEHELGIEKQQREIEEEEEKTHVAELQDKIAGGRKARLEAAEADARERKAALAKKWNAKDEKARIAQGVEEEKTLKENRGAEGAREISKEFAKTLEKNRVASREECDRLLPLGGQHIFDMISNRLNENMASGIQLAIEVDRDQLFAGQKYDLATEYVRIMAKYRKAVESKSKDIQQKTLEQLTRINRTLGIPLNAEVESHLEKEDLGYAREQLKMDQAEFVADQLKRAIQERPSTPMSVERVKKFGLVKRAAELWDDLVTKLPQGQENLATEYVMALARVNEASRAVNVSAYDQAKETLDHMSTVFGVQGRADIQSETLPRPGEKYENPF